MKDNVRFDFVTNTITVKKGYYEQACKYGTDEHNEFMRLKADYPNMRIAVRSVRTGNRKSDTKGITYEYMRRFIAIMDSKNLLEFNKVQIHYGLFESDKTKVFHLVRQWFLETYPYHRDMIIEAAPKAVIDSIPQIEMPLCG